MQATDEEGVVSSQVATTNILQTRWTLPDTSRVCTRGLAVAENLARIHNGVIERPFPGRQRGEHGREREFKMSLKACVCV